MLTPSIKLSYSNICSKINICETTGIYSTANNGGWGSPNINPSDVVSSYIKIYDYSGVELLQTIVIKNNFVDNYPSSITGTMSIMTDVDWSQSDGCYKVVYEVNTLTDKYLNSDNYVLFDCNIGNCIDNLVCKISDSCDDTKKKRMYDLLEQLEIIQYAMCCAMSGGVYSKIASLSEDAKIICDTITNCPCNNC